MLRSRLCLRDSIPIRHRELRRSVSSAGPFSPIDPPAFSTALSRPRPFSKSTTGFFHYRVPGFGRVSIRLLPFRHRAPNEVCLLAMTLPAARRKRDTSPDPRSLLYRRRIGLAESCPRNLRNRSDDPRPQRRDVFLLSSREVLSAMPRISKRLPSEAGNRNATGGPHAFELQIGKRRVLPLAPVFRRSVQRFFRNRVSPYI